MGDQKLRRKVAFSSVILILVLVMVYSGLQILESTVFYQEAEETAPSSKTITRDGISYFPRQDITVMMVLGIDQFGPVQDSGSYNNTGASDLVMLMIFDETNETIRVLSLNRDTMLDMPVLGIGGKRAGTAFGQLALAHTYGSGLEDSCENIRKAVSDFLYGIKIDYYVSINMDAITILNDAVGGVTVTVTEDFSAVDPSIGMGEVTLQGQQAIHYVRSRKDVANQMNITRMERQIEYAEGFLDAVNKKLEEGTSFVVSAYDDISDYMVTDCSSNAILGMMERYAGYTLVEIVSPEGENVKGESYMEFYVDEEALDELILRLFYAPKQ